MMFTMDMPTIPVQETPIALAQAAAPAAGTSPQPDYILNTCKETESTGDPRSAMHAVDPASMLRNYLENRGTRLIEITAIKNIAMLQDAKHGKISSVIDNTGRTWYRYEPIPSYVGNDRAAFQAEFEGRVYKIVVDIKVLMVIDDNSPQCDPPRLIKVNKPSSGGSGSGTGYRFGPVSVIFEP